MGTTFWAKKNCLNKKKNKLTTAEQVSFERFIKLKLWYNIFTKHFFFVFKWRYHLTVKYIYFFGTILMSMAMFSIQ